MSKLDLSAMTKNVKVTLKRHSSEILTGICVAGMISTTILAVKGTPKALMLIEEKKLDDDVETLTPIETVKVTWKCYIPAFTVGTLSILCIIGANSVNARRNAALATAYSLSESALKDYKSKVLETVGEKKEKEVREEIAKDKIAKNPVTEIVVTDHGNTLFFDDLSGRYFRYDLDKFNRVINELNSRMIKQTDYISLNEFYIELDIPELCPTKVGDILGWNHTKDDLIEVDLTPMTADNGQPCFFIDFVKPPTYDFDTWG